MIDFKCICSLIGWKRSASNGEIAGSSPARCTMTKVDKNKIIRKDPPMRYDDGDVGNFVVIIIFIILILYALIV